MKATLNMQVSAHHGSCSVGGMFINETFLNGKVIKVNAKSIRVELSEEICTCNGKEKSRRAINQTETSRFSKTLSDGKDAFIAYIGCYRHIIRL